MLIERLALRRMIGQPVIMALMLTLGIEIMLRGLLPGIFGSAVKRLDIGIPQAPLFVGDFLELLYRLVFLAAVHRSAS